MRSLSSPRLREPLVVLGASVVATLLFFHRLLSTGGALCERDMLRVFAPAKAYWAHAVSQGVWPGWYPFNALGQPFAGATVTGVFHPANVLALLFDGPGALTAMALLCYPLAATGTYLFLRARDAFPFAAALGALAFALSGYLVSLTNNLLYLQAATALPWLLLIADSVLARGSWSMAGALGCVLPTVLFAGDPQGFTVCGATVLLVVVLCPLGVGVTRRRVLLVTGTGLLLAALVATAQLWASASVLGETFAERRTAESAQLWSVHPLRLLDLAVGNVFALEPPLRGPVAQGLLGMQTTDFWARSLYVGLPVLFLAGVCVVARRRERWVQVAVGFSVLGLLLMFGRHTPLYGFVYDLVPPWRAFRYPEKLTVHVTFWLAVLAAWGAQDLLDRARGGRRRAGWGLVGLGAGMLLLALTGAGLWLAQALRGFYSGPDASWAELSRQVGERLTVDAACVAVTCVGMGLFALFAAHPRQVGLGWVLLLAADLYRVSEPIYVSCDQRLLTTAPPFVEELQRREGPSLPGRARVYTASGIALPETVEGLTPDEAQVAGTRMVLAADSASAWGVESANWYLPALSARVADLLKDQRQWWNRYGPLAGVGYFVADETQVEERRLRNNVLSTSEPFKVSLLAHPRPLPRVYLAPPRCVSGPEESLAVIASPDFVPGQQAVVECREPLPTAPPGGDSGKATLTRYGVDEVEVEVDATRPSVLVLSDAYFTGWSATVDEVPTEVLPANHALRAVAVPAGAHRVVWRYAPPGEAASLAVSGLGLLLCLLTWVAAPLRRRLRREGPKASEAPRAATTP
ncbi:YfhO family protein [Myxococcus llanfairpwllgwyngyllgogerychwyrndrobwllllantysiliogogogochensis]|uniref:YfhO family protein n=2 Tax=Myxococcaceae TaxID=31 RepID=A0A540WLI9_9BACT|nr:YfhO family protein [Myxococcus llanfairpwllgwyngyllgogerychwyrndrobwllllantysiliogogogochensis]TQF09707.1 YfhO family protein [Myxococcus llanfairpwllgwyngyllgogerychwyrndrobwllllantysiliogogogochensis]